MNITIDKKLELADIAINAAKGFKGQADDLERAIGMLFLAQLYGWKVLYLADSHRYIRKCEDILKIKFRDISPEETELSHRSLAFKMLKGVTNFWKAAKGEAGHNIRDSTIK